MISSLVIGLFIIWVYRRFKRQRRIALLLSTSEAAKAHHESLIASTGHVMEQVQTTLTQIQQSREIEQGLIQSAIDREARARAALVAVLRRFDCDEIEIQTVLDKLEMEL